MSIVSVGVPGWPSPSTSWDWWPFIGVALVCAIGVRSFGVRFRMPLFATAVALGPVFATAVHRWGVVPSFGWVVIGAMGIAFVRRGIAAHRRPPAV
jgi:hypothetical protein